MPASPRYDVYDSDIAPVAALIADPSRAAMLTALLDGRPLAAGELARLADVSPATASAHLGRLLEGGLVAVTRQGRHRYYQLAGPQIGAVLEAMAEVSPRTPVRGLHQSRKAAALEQARTCYDHLAGRAGVALLDALLGKGILTGADASTEAGAEAAAGAGVGAGSERSWEHGDRAYDVTALGSGVLAELGIDVGAARRSRRRFAGACLDWTQRRPHLNGALGAAITARLFELGWIERAASPSRMTRAVRVTTAGREGLAGAFGWADDE